MYTNFLSENSEDLEVDGKGKVVPVFNQAPRHEGVLGSGGIAPCILDLGTRWRWVVSFTPRSLYPQGKSLWCPLDRGWVGPRAVLDAVVKRKIPSPRQESNPRTPIVQPVAQRYTDWAITALHRRRLDDNIRMDLKDIVWEAVDWIHLAQNRDQLRALANM
jgi:hypothetical protein